MPTSDNTTQKSVKNDKELLSEINPRVKVDSVFKYESEQFYESTSDDSIDLNSIVLKLADVENFNVNEGMFNVDDDKFTTITLRSNREYDKDGNEIDENVVDGNSNENINFIDFQNEIHNDFSLKQAEGVRGSHDSARFTSKKITRVNKMVAVAIDSGCSTQTYVDKLENDNEQVRRNYSTNDCNMINIINRNIKGNIASVGVNTNSGNTNDLACNTGTNKNAAENSSPSDDSSASASVTDGSVNSLLNRLQYGIKDESESSETDCSTASSDEEMTSLDSGIRTVIYESAGSKDFGSIHNELNPELKRIDNVKATTKSSCVLS